MFVCIMWLRVGDPDSIVFFVTESFVVGMKEGSVLVFVVGFDDVDFDRISVGNKERVGKGSPVNGFAVDDTEGRSVFFSEGVAVGNLDSFVVTEEGLSVFFNDVMVVGFVATFTIGNPDSFGDGTEEGFSVGVAVCIVKRFVV